jgi:exodeoxyribonuclease VII large subunit
LAQVAQRLKASHPRRQLNRRLQELDDLHTARARAIRRGLEQRQLACRNLRLRLGRLRPSRLLTQRREALGEHRERLRQQMRNILRTLSQQCGQLGARLRLLGPEQVLARGYSITLDAGSGKVIRAASATRPGQKLRTRLKTGEVLSVVEGKKGAG